MLTIVAVCLRPHALPTAARATSGPFAILALIIAGSGLAGRLGLFRALARWLVRDDASRAVAAASMLVLTALLAGLVNLDVAVVVATPVCLVAAGRHGLPAGRTAVAVAITANAASFLLPTANITTLLLLGSTRLPALAYVRFSWLAWLLVVAVTIGALASWLASGGPASARPVPGGPASFGRAGNGPPGRAALDLLPMFVSAAAIRAILATGITLRGDLAAQLVLGSALACGVNNLPAAALLHPAGLAGLWAAILATAIGPGVLVFGSVATMICRRIARDASATLSFWRYTSIGLILVPAQLAVAVIGLRLTGALH
ncbi:MAG: hypothetical protein J2P28_15585 [Actinobacteria bacterium]|nr:hypothetical protein [Actinomycetota bacterium]